MPFQSGEKFRDIIKMNDFFCLGLESGTEDARFLENETPE